MRWLLWLFTAGVVAGSSWADLSIDDGSGLQVNRKKPKLPTAIANHPWQLFLVTQLAEGVSACGAVLLAQEWAITTAHCMAGVRAASVLGGASGWVDMMVGRAGIQVPVLYHLVHPDYRPTADTNDLALLRLKIVNGSESLTPITLPFRAKLSKLEGKKVTISGWGAATGFSSLLSPSLQAAELRVDRHSACAAAYGAKVDWPDVMCCRGRKGSAAGICRGDSGGAVAHRKGKTHYLVGVAAFRDPSCKADAPTGFVRIDRHLRWITKITGIR